MKPNPLEPTVSLTCKKSRCRYGVLLLDKARITSFKLVTPKFVPNLFDNASAQYILLGRANLNGEKRGGARLTAPLHRL